MNVNRNKSVDLMLGGARLQSKRKFILGIVLAFFLVMILVDFIKLPVGFASIGIPVKLEAPDYLPFTADQQYAQVVTYNKVKLVYELGDDTLTIWVTSDIGWNNVSSWDEKVTLPDGTGAHYTETAEAQMFSWRKGELEYAIDHTGEPLSKEELIMIASSIE